MPTFFANMRKGKRPAGQPSIAGFFAAPARPLPEPEAPRAPHPFLLPRASAPPPPPAATNSAAPGAPTWREQEAPWDARHAGWWRAPEGSVGLAPWREEEPSPTGTMAPLLSTAALEATERALDEGWASQCTARPPLAPLGVTRVLDASAVAALEALNALPLPEPPLEPARAAELAASVAQLVAAGAAREHWAHALAPPDAELLVDAGCVRQFGAWLDGWRDGAPAAAVDADEWCDGPTRGGGCVVVGAGSGVGKTQLVRVEAARRGLAVLEVSMGVARRGQDIARYLAEATQSQGAQGRQLLLFEDADIECDADSGYHAAVAQLLAASRVPIVLVAHVHTVALRRLCAGPAVALTLHVRAAPRRPLLWWLLSVAREAAGAYWQPADCWAAAVALRYDVRALLLRLQLEAGAHGPLLLAAQLPAACAAVYGSRAAALCGARPFTTDVGAQRVALEAVATGEALFQLWPVLVGANDGAALVLAGAASWSAQLEGLDLAAVHATLMALCARVWLRPLVLVAPADDEAVALDADVEWLVAQRQAQLRAAVAQLRGGLPAPTADAGRDVAAYAALMGRAEPGGRGRRKQSYLGRVAPLLSAEAAQFVAEVGRFDVL